MFLQTPPFPECISSGATAGPRWATSVTELDSGHERRNQLWSRPRYQYQVGRNIMSENDARELVRFFNAVNGMTHGFRFHDRLDYTSGLNNAEPTAADQDLGTGDGTTVEFQLRKVETVGATTFVRDILTPVAGKTVLAIGGVELGAGDFTVGASGVVTLTTAPAPGAPVTGGFEFDVPCRFDTDELTPALLNFEAGSYDVGLVEIRDLDP